MEAEFIGRCEFEMKIPNRPISAAVCRPALLGGATVEIDEIAFVLHCPTRCKTPRSPIAMASRTEIFFQISPGAACVSLTGQLFGESASHFDHPIARPLSRISHRWMRRGKSRW